MSSPTAPSALSLSLSRHANGATPRALHSQSPTLAQITEQPQYFDSLADTEQAISTVDHHSVDRTLLSTSNIRSEVSRFASSPATENTPLLPPPLNGSLTSINGHGSKHSKSSKQLGRTVLKSLPAVLLGTLLNILDGVSYGMIIFPAFGVFAGLGGMGVSMFFVSTVVAQLVYCLGGSSFAGANGSMMIEVVPFFHILAATIAREIGDEYPKEIIATTIAAYALSSVLTGLTFFLLGYLRLGVLIGFFPRHILVGCIGGVGIFLILTGLTVSTRLPSDALDPPTLETLRYFLLNTHALAQWVPPLVLAVLLRVITMRWKHQLVFPIYFMIIPAAFYVVVAAARLDLGALRRDGWLFDAAEGAGGAEDRWYGFYSYLDLGLIKFAPIWTTLPIQFALLFFNILHPPLNVPALSVSLDEDIDTNKELVGHGYSNLLAGFLGTVPNYLVYVNTLLFYRVGGGTRTAGFLLAVATFILLILGTWPIAYIPVMVVSALIFVLGLDLVKEALWDTRNRVSRMEYITIISIMVTMTAWDFVIGVLFGIVVSCFFFVVQNSQRRSIRACYAGDSAISTVRRPAAHRAYIREVSKQTRVLRLQGFLFFGTIAHVEETLRNIVEGAAWQRNPVRFVVVDLSLVVGVDMSAAEAFVRVQRLLAAKGVVLVFCGVTPDSTCGKALSSVGVLQESFVEVFETLNDAMEWTENAYLRAWFRAQKSWTTPISLPGRRDTKLSFDESLTGSPRQMQLRDVGERTIAGENSSEPYNTLLNAFSSYHDVDQNTFRQIAPYFERFTFPEGFVLWENNDTSDGLYIIESGVLRASYKFAEHSPVIEESMVSGTLAGEISALSNMPRNARVVVEQQVVLWKLSLEHMRQLETEHPHLAQTFVQLVLKSAKVDTDILLAALATR
ncbi:sulfate transporter family-domain-containing protein [Suillus paluster]|uniref:sulfate transporter family-domain-containing protein n=1 Tax=Suillus paluster TaxID=48578 RepID=UPI001B86590F|nr:sulfate transporter family-domain-containing protein [Suillus paluster]KAG1744926.1 sulfate transporter family-domain-containing protein [Suillus paluster]